MPMTPLFIEFVGLPGAGKTTIARGVVTELTRLGFRCSCNGNLSSPHHAQPVQVNRLAGKFNTLSQLLRACGAHQQITRHALRCAAWTNPPRLINFRRVADLLIRLDLIKTNLASNNQLVIFDQGVIQCVWSIAATGDLPPDKYLLRLLASILGELSLVLIHIQVDADTAAARIKQRSTMSSRFDRMPTLQTKQLLTRQSRFFDKLTQWQGELPSMDRLTVDGRCPVNENVGCIVDFIQALVSPAGKLQAVA